MIIYFGFVCRNRLENNAEYWNALLLSLRELIEWVIRKDTELSSLALTRENPPSIQKQQVITYIFFGANVNIENVCKIHVITSRKIILLYVRGLFFCNLQ